jgi:hypothetical protein
MKVLLAAAAVAAMMFSATTADAQSSGPQCAANCKAYCDKNWPGNAHCTGNCVTKKCNK